MKEVAARSIAQREVLLNTTGWGTGCHCEVLLAPMAPVLATHKVVETPACEEKKQTSPLKYSLMSDISATR